MKYEDFDKLLKGLDLLSNVKIRDSVVCPIPRGYNIRVMDRYLILIPADGSMYVCFDYWDELIPDDVVSLYFEGKQIGAIGIKDMEVVE